jgi:hypothetical protein
MGEEEQTHVLPGTRRSGNDAEVASVLDLDDDAFEKAVGRELQYLRTTRTGLSRRLFVKTFPGNMPINTYACYEQGIRPCPLARLVVICHALGTTVGQVVENALTSLGKRPEVAAGDACLDNIERALTELVAAQGHLRALRIPATSDSEAAASGDNSALDGQEPL